MYTFILTAKQCEEKSTTMQPMVVGKLSKSKKSYPKCVQSVRSRQCVVRGKVRIVMKSKEK